MQEEITRLKRDQMNATNTIRQINNSKTKTRPRGEGKSSSMTCKDVEDFKSNKSQCCPDYNSNKGCPKSKDDCSKRHK